ncbi:MAG: phosphate acyltransferase PlsX [Clostridiales bacterium]|nr:phosphate acyltransferase PlsX [Clostridiales bacterium]
MKVIVDAFGGDNAPLEIIRGAAQAAREYGYEILLAGREREIRETAEKNGVSLENIAVADAPGVITMEDGPKSILKEHKDCSMAEGLRRLAAGEGDAFVSAGNTGALIMGATFIVKRIRGVSRAALAPLMPTNAGVPFMLIDAGANVDCRPEMLLQFAHMGSLYMTKVLGGGRTAQVGLLNVGTEEGKGGDLQHDAYHLIRESGLRFVGNVEARDLPFHIADVIVADGFSGNVALKMMEGTADVLMGFIREIFTAGWASKLAYLLVKPGLRALKRKMDTSEYGGAPLLGVARPVIKAHGNSGAAAIKNAVRVAAEFSRAGVIEDIAAAVRSAGPETAVGE